MNMIKNPVLQFIIWASLLSHPAFAQGPVEIEIDSATVEVGIEKPSEPAKQAEADKKRESRVSPAIWIGGLAAAVAAAVGGGGSGGGNSATTHAPGTQ